MSEKEMNDAGTEASRAGDSEQAAANEAGEAPEQTSDHHEPESPEAPDAADAPAEEAPGDGEASDGSNGEEADVDAGGDEEQVVRRHGWNFVGRPPKYNLSTMHDARRKAKQGLPLNEEEQRLWDRWRIGHERMRMKNRDKNQLIANRIAELHIIECLTTEQIAKKLNWRDGRYVRNFKSRHPDLMENAHARLRKIVEQEQDARLISVDDQFTKKATAALGVFDDHLDGRRVGKLNPAVRQRAAEKVIEFMQKGKERGRVPGGFDAKALSLIGERQKSLRAKNDVVTTGEVVSSEETPSVR